MPIYLALLGNLPIPSYVSMYVCMCVCVAGEGVGVGVGDGSGVFSRYPKVCSAAREVHVIV